MYFADLSWYSLGGPAAAPSRNVGWLDEHRPFPRERPSAQLLDAIWEHCAILVMPTRGLHACAFCPQQGSVFERDGTRLRLGSGEIRVFGPSRDAYAAPNMIYHYVLEHHYRPPADFLGALSEGPRPQSDDYLERLRQLGVPWRANLPIAEEPTAFRFARTETGVSVVTSARGKGE